MSYCVIYFVIKIGLWGISGYIFCQHLWKTIAQLIFVLFASLFSYLQKEDEVLGFSEIKYAGLKNWKHFRRFRSGSEKATVMMDSLLKLPVMIYTENIYIKQVYSASAPSLVTFPGHMWNSLNFIKQKACLCFPLIFNDSSLRCFCVCFSHMRFLSFLKMQNSCFQFSVWCGCADPCFSVKMYWTKNKKYSRLFSTILFSHYETKQTHHGLETSKWTPFQRDFFRIQYCAKT